MIAAVFTYRLGVSGTLIGMELTTVVITLSSAIFKAQLMMASHHLASLRKRCGPVLRTADSHPRQSEHRTEPGGVHARQGHGRLSRLRAMPGFLRELPSPQRPRVLLAGLLAGLLATVIGLALSPVLSSSEARSSPLRSGPAQRGFQLGRVIQ